MSAEIPETWTTRELPVLANILRRFDAGELLVDLEDVRAELQMRGPQMWAAASALRDAWPPTSSSNSAEDGPMTTRAA